MCCVLEQETLFSESHRSITDYQPNVSETGQNNEREGGEELIAIGHTHSLVLDAEDAEDKQRQTSMGRADWPLKMNELSYEAGCWDRNKKCVFCID